MSSSKPWRCLYHAEGWVHRGRPCGPSSALVTWLHDQFSLAVQSFRFFFLLYFPPRFYNPRLPNSLKRLQVIQVWLPREGCWAKCVTGPVRFSCTAMSPSLSSRGSVVVLDGSWSLTCFVFDWSQLSGQRCCDQVLYTAIGKGWIHVWKGGVSRWDFFDHLVL